MTEHELFRRITTQVCGTLDIAAGLEAAYSILEDVLPLCELRLNVLDTDLHAVKTVATADRKGSRTMLGAPLVMPMPPDVEFELKGGALEDIRIVNRIEDDRATSAVRSEYFADTPPSSLLIMRLLLDGRRQGVLLLRAEGEGRYGEEHKELMASLNEPFAIALNNAMAHHELDRLRNSLKEQNQLLYDEVRGSGADIIGASFGLASVMKLVDNVAGQDSPVLLLGETGVGKEVVADSIHEASPRRDGPFIKLNCGAIPASLAESELFGHEKGAFTGAVAMKKGRFELADGGTLFLDEIGELQPDMQVKLLRVLHSSTFERVGGNRSLRSNVRIIAATHRNLAEMVKVGQFREDLWYRINVFPIHVPPLRERRADIPALVHYFIEKKSSEMGIPSRPELPAGTMQKLKNYRWPGNVRELENAVERALLLRDSGSLEFDWLEEGQASATRITNKENIVSLDEAVTDHIRTALSAAEGKIEGPGGAAELLKLNASTLRHKMRRLGIPFGRK